MGFFDVVSPTTLDVVYSCTILLYPEMILPITKCNKCSRFIHLYYFLRGTSAVLLFKLANIK